MLHSFSVIANGPVKCATVDRQTFESTIGSLSQIIADDKRRRDERSSALSGAGPPLSALKRLGAVNVDEFSSTVVCRIEGEGMSGGEPKHALRVIYKKSVVEQKHQEALTREMDLLKSLSKHSQFSNCPSLPSLLSTYSDPQNLYVLYQDPLSCSLACIGEELGGKWDDSQVKHVAMCALLGLEAIHAHGVVYRGVNSESLVLTESGNVVLSNFQYARQNPEGNVTICGPPEYLAPEVVQQQGHGAASDLWQLGVALYELAQGGTPFEAPNELDVYAKICRHRYGTLGTNLKEGTHLKSKQGVKCLQFLEACIHPDPAMRLTAGAAKKDGWFTSSEWKKLSNPR